MYPANFDYTRANSLDEAKAATKSGAKPLAGGHSLVPAMKYRVANPGSVVDIARAVPAGISVTGDDVTVGAMTTHASVAKSPVAAAKCPMLAQAAAGIGDQMVRNRGTIGGSVAHADPQADYPIVLRTLGAHIKTANGKTHSSETFFTDLFTTALDEGDIITEVVVNGYGAGTGAHYYKIPHPASGYAVVGAGAMVTVKDGKVTRASIVVGGATGNPVRCSNAEEGLIGVLPNEDNIERAGKLAARSIKDPIGDHYASGAYRTHLATVAVQRAVAAAVKAAGG